MIRSPLLVALVAAAGTCWAGPAGGADGPPNIVLIISDDQAWTDFGFMGNRQVRTPNLDRLAAGSARFPNGYVPSSVCRPSLATLLTGLFPHEHGIHFNHPPDKANRHRADYLIRAVPTLPRLLREAGYRSLQTGKFWEGHFRNAGFDDGMTLGRPAAIEKPLGLRPAHGNGDAGLAIGRETMQPLFEFIDRDDPRPFFIWFAPYLPHTPHNAPRRLTDLYADDPAVPRHFVRYFAACTEFDQTVGALVDHVERRGLARRTLFVFVVDNGWEPAPRSRPDSRSFVNTRSKRSPFDLGLRTPLLIRWDGHVRPGSHEALVSTVDIVPTLLAAAGLTERGRGLPGRDLLPAATGRAELSDRPVFGEIYPGDATSLGHPSRDLSYRWVRRGPWKLIVPHLRNGRVWRSYVTRPALFNVAADPREEHDLADLHPERVAALREDLDAVRRPGDDTAVAKPPQ